MLLAQTRRELNFSRRFCACSFTIHWSQCRSSRRAALDCWLHWSIRIVLLSDQVFGRQSIPTMYVTGKRKRGILRKTLRNTRTSTWETPVNCDVGYWWLQLRGHWISAHLKSPIALRVLKLLLRLWISLLSRLMEGIVWRENIRTNEW